MNFFNVYAENDVFTDVTNDTNETITNNSVNNSTTNGTEENNTTNNSATNTTIGDNTTTGDESEKTGFENVKITIEPENANSNTYVLKISNLELNKNVNFYWEIKKDDPQSTATDSGMVNNLGSIPTEYKIYVTK